MIRTTDAQRRAMIVAMSSPTWHLNEVVWNYLVADAMEKSPDRASLLGLLCGEDVRDAGDVWFESQPLPPRKGTRGCTETNSVLDLALGDVRARGTTQGGIEHDPRAPGSWACFIEGKFLADCDVMVTHDPLRNQLERVIESLLCFQHRGVFPDQLYFTMLTPRVFKANPHARLYGYKMEEYSRDTSGLIADIERCPIPVRDDGDHAYPVLAHRSEQLRLNWVTYEDILERELGVSGIDVFEPGRIGGLESRRATALAELMAIVSQQPEGS